MRIVADLHIHGRYSRGCSNDLDFKNLEKYARIKGLDLLGTGDFTHPKWIEDIKKDLKDDGTGILKTKTGFPFILQTEFSLIYSQEGKGRRVHNVILAPSLEIVEQITEEMLKIGRVDYDGRPIFGINCIEFTERMIKISKDIEIIPAHIWTPWFSLFGSNSGFNTIKDCFKENTKYIHALETGLSSDPAMNWRLSQLDNFALVSFSDLHSYWPWRIGREATIFDLDLTYKNLIKALRTKEGLEETIEVDPNYGKYHFDGHRNCNVCLAPQEALKNKNICPKCGRNLTIGVAHRVEELADRPEGFKPKNAKPFKSLIPLSEILSKLLDSGIATKKVWVEYQKLINEFKSENNILLNVPFEQLKGITEEKIAEMIIKNREGKIKIQPGYDGEYGIPVFSDKDVKEVTTKLKHKQTSLEEF